VGSTPRSLRNRVESFYQKQAPLQQALLLHGLRTLLREIIQETLDVKEVEFGDLKIEAKVQCILLYKKLFILSQVCFIFVLQVLRQELLDLNKAREQGLITEKEYATQKKKILKR